MRKTHLRLYIEETNSGAGRNNPDEAMQRYVDIDPRQHGLAVEPDLMSALNSLTDSNPENHHLLAAGAIAAELTLSQAVYSSVKARRTSSIGRSLLSHVSTPSTQLAKTRYLDLMDVITQDRSPVSHRERTAARIHQLIERHDTTPKLNERAGVIGSLGEEVVTYLLHAPKVGLYAFPSFGRQKRTGSRIDDMKYNWDVTIESDGDILPYGQYRAQVNTSLNSTTYHPDILLLGLPIIFPKHPDGSTLAAARAIDSGDTETVVQHSARLLHALTGTAPVSSKLAYAPVVRAL